MQQPELASVADAQAASHGTMCPLCHTSHGALTPDAVNPNVSWKCDRCGQRWDADSLATVSAYSAWTTVRELVAAR